MYWIVSQDLKGDFFWHYFQILTWKTVPNVEKQTKMNTQPLPPIQTTQLLDLLVSFLCPVAIAVCTYVALSCCGLPQVACRIASCDFQKTEKGADQTFSQCCFITLASSCPQRKLWSRNSIAAIPSVLVPRMPTTAWKGPGAPDELSEMQGSHLWTCVSPTSEDGAGKEEGVSTVVLIDTSLSIGSVRKESS